MPKRTRLLVVLIALAFSIPAGAAQYYWSSTSSTDPLLVGNWTKSDGTTNTVPQAGDDLYLQPVAGSTIANIWASGGVLTAPGGSSFSGASATGGHLVSGTTYYYKVTATNASGESLPSAEVTYVPPSGSAAQITLNIPAVSGATGYKVYRTALGTGQEVFIGSTATTTFVDTVDVPTANTASPPPGVAAYNSINIKIGFSQTIGIAGQNGYWAASPVQLNIWGANSGRIKINWQGTNTIANVYSTGTSVDAGQEAVRLLGAGSTGKLNVLGGTVGFGTNTAGEAGTLSSASVTNGNTALTLGEGITWTNGYVADGGVLTTNTGNASGTINITNGSVMNAYGAVTLHIVNNHGTLNSDNRPNSANIVDTLNNYGTVNFTGNPATGSIGNYNVFPGAADIVNPGNSTHISFGTTTATNVAKRTYQ